MLKRILMGAGLCALAATLAYAQDTAPPAGGRGAPGGGRAARPQVIPTQAQWDDMNAAGKAYVAKASAEAP